MTSEEEYKMRLDYERVAREDAMRCEQEQEAYNTYNYDGYDIHFVEANPVNIGLIKLHNFYTPTVLNKEEHIKKPKYIGVYGSTKPYHGGTVLDPPPSKDLLKQLGFKNFLGGD